MLFFYFLWEKYGSTALNFVDSTLDYKKNSCRPSYDFISKQYKILYSLILFYNILGGLL